MKEPERGMLVIGQRGQIGTVETVMSDDSGGASRILVRRDDGQTLLLENNTYRVEDGSVHIVGDDDLFKTQRINDVNTVSTYATATTRDESAGESIVIPVVREEVHVGKRVVEGGGVRVHKRVEEREEVVEQPVFHEDVTVERVAIGRPIDAVIGSRQEGDTLIVPVLEEMLVVEKRLVLKEEIRITKRRVEETEKATVILREEHVDIEQIENPAARGL